MKAHNLLGKKFGKLTVISRDFSKKGRAHWFCKCDCGKTKKNSVNSYDLIKGKVSSCNCLYKEVSKEANTKHGLSNHRLHRIWCTMRRRCYSPKMNEYENYGGRGIIVCDKWQGTNGFINFYNWAITNGYSPNLTIDRIDNDGNYCPENCRWSTQKEQQNNKSSNRIVQYQNRFYTVSQLATKLDIPYATLLWRINNNWREEDLKMKPNLNNAKIRRNNYVIQ